MTISSFSLNIILDIICPFSCSNIVSWEAQWILHLNYLLQDIIIHDSTYELIMIPSSSICRILLFNHSLKILIHHGSTHKPWCMHNNMYMAFILNPFYLLLASPWNKHPSVHPIFFMHWKWNFPSNVQLNANISPLGLSSITKTTHGDYVHF